jgi:ribosome-binding factor A
VGFRLLRINESVKEALSTIISAEGLKDPRVGFVTLTGVRVSRDLRHAKVYLSVLGTSAERESTMEALENSRGYLQSRLGQSLHLRRTPQLQFFYDDALDNALHIQKLLKMEEAVLGSVAPDIVVDGESEAPERSSAGAGDDSVADGDARDGGKSES